METFIIVFVAGVLFLSLYVAKTSKNNRERIANEKSDS